MIPVLPDQPGAVIGYRRNGTPVRLIAGGSEPAEGVPDAAPPPAPETPPAEPPAPPAAGSAAEPAPEPPAVPPRDVADLPEFAQRIIKEARNDAAKYRTQVRETEQRVTAQLEQQRSALAKALGLEPEEVTPEKLAAERDAEKARADSEAARWKTTAVELATFRAASAMGADLGKLMDSRTFVATLDGLDPSSDGFGESVRDKVSAALEANPGFRLASPAPAPAAGATVPAAGAPAAPPPLQPPPIPASGPQGSFTTPPPPGGRQLSEADAARMSPQAVVEAINNGQFQGENFGPKRSSYR